MKKYPKTPELDKMRDVKDKSQHIGEFVEWLNNEGYSIATRGLDDLLYPTNLSIERLLANYYKIDLCKCENEREAILLYLREHLNDKSNTGDVK